jgi:hypothetical protein
MLGTLRMNPRLSASTHIGGQYDYNRAPGSRIITNEMSNHRRMWPLMDKMVCTVDQLWNIMDVTQCTSPEVNEL